MTVILEYVSYRNSPDLFHSTVARCSLTLHPENAEPGFFDRRIERRGEGEAEKAPRLGRIDDAVVPQPRARVVRMALALILCPDGVFKRFFILIGLETSAYSRQAAGRQL